MTDPRMDADQAAYTQAIAERGAAYPVLVIPADPRAGPFDEPRRINDLHSAPLHEGGPVMAQTRELWLPIRGRRLAVPAAHARPRAAAGDALHPRRRLGLGQHRQP